VAARGEGAAAGGGYLHFSSPEPFAYQVDAFRKGLSETGYLDGRNVGIEFRADNDHDRLREMAADLVRRRGERHRHAAAIRRGREKSMAGHRKMHTA